MRKFLVVGGLAGLLLGGCGGSTGGSTSGTSSSSVALTGAGSTFDYPFFSKAFAVYRAQKQVAVNYQPVGSGAGIQQLTQKLVDFGASDVPMNAAEQAAAQKVGGSVEQIPVALGGVSVAYHLAGIPSGLKLSAATIAGIYLGQITAWDSPAIQRLNPSFHLPAVKITVVHRSDSSGTSYIFSDYLSHVNPGWGSSVGATKTPNWPVGIGGKGNLGVAQLVQQINGGVGYVELAYVLQTHMTEAAVQNRSGTFVQPTLSRVSAAAAQFPSVSAQHFSIVNAPGANSYPITGYSWVLFFERQPKTLTRTALTGLLRWTVTTGQTYAAQLDYAPLPGPVQQLGRQAIGKVTS